MDLNNTLLSSTCSTIKVAEKTLVPLHLTYFIYHICEL